MAVQVGERQVFPTPLAYGKQATALTGSVLGGSNAWFAGGQLGRVTYAESDNASTLAGLIAGVQVPVGPGRRVMLCPVVEVNNEFGPADATPNGWKTSTLAVNGGASVGFVAATVGSVQIVPAVGLGVSRTNVKVEYPTQEVSAYRLSDSDIMGQVDVGVGVVVNRRFTVATGWTAPFGSEAYPTVVGPVRYAGSVFRIAIGLNLTR